jgi:hypothetical protein
MDTDYTVGQPVLTSLQDALDLALGEGRLHPGEIWKATHVDEVAAIVRAVHDFGAEVTLGPPGPEQVGISLEQLNSVRELDAVSGTITVEAGIKLAELAETLASEGLEIQPGHLGDAKTTIGEALAQGQGSALVISTGAVLPDGTLFHTPLAPRRATGPNPDALLVGAGSCVGIVVWVTLRIRARSEKSVSAAFVGDGATVLECIRTLLRGGIRPQSVTATKGAKGRLTVAWTVQSNDEIDQIAAAFSAADCSVSKMGNKWPPAGRRRRLRWSQLEPLVRGSGRSGLWLGPMDVYGGWACAPGEKEPNDSLLDALVNALDPQHTLTGSNP